MAAGVPLPPPQEGLGSLGTTEPPPWPLPPSPWEPALLCWWQHGGQAGPWGCRLQTRGDALSRQLTNHSPPCSLPTAPSSSWEHPAGKGRRPGGGFNSEQTPASFALKTIRAGSRNPTRTKQRAPLSAYPALPGQSSTCGGRGPGLAAYGLCLGRPARLPPAGQENPARASWESGLV